MRHDAKLGLALGMLVIGFAVAFCFPRPQPQTARKIEPVPPPISQSTLELLPIRTYQVGKVTDAAPQPSPLDTAPTAGSSAPTPITIAGVPLTADQLSGVAPLTDPAVGISIRQPQPGRSGTRIDETDLNQAPRQTASEQNLYVVKAGDTLTGIAIRLLGNSARYAELFEANQDVLSSPNDLKIGMKLVIPPLIPVKESVHEAIAETREKKEPMTHTPGLPAAPKRDDYQHPPPAPWIAEEPRIRR